MRHTPHHVGRPLAGDGEENHAHDAATAWVACPSWARTKSCAASVPAVRYSSASNLLGHSRQEITPAGGVSLTCTSAHRLLLLLPDTGIDVDGSDPPNARKQPCGLPYGSALEPLVSENACSGPFVMPAASGWAVPNWLGVSGKLELIAIAAQYVELTAICTGVASGM